MPNVVLMKNQTATIRTVESERALKALCGDQWLNLSTARVSMLNKQPQSKALSWTKELN